MTAGTAAAFSLSSCSLTPGTQYTIVLYVDNGGGNLDGTQQHLFLTPPVSNSFLTPPLVSAISANGVTVAYRGAKSGKVWAFIRAVDPAALSIADAIATTNAVGNAGTCKKANEAFTVTSGVDNTFTFTGCSLGRGLVYLRQC